MADSDLIFFVNGKQNILPKPDPELTGTKLGCGEGGCGACTVMVSYYTPDSDAVRHLSANACLLPLCSLHGIAVTTVEGIGSLRTRLHPVQKRLAAAHGSQCGFCTPGFVMSMYTLLRNNPTPSLDDLETVFDGNLCRCTGYRPIIEGYRPFTKGFCEKGENFTWYRPSSLSELLDIKKRHPDCKIIIGNTELGIETKFKKQLYPVLVAATHVRELSAVNRQESGIQFGASVTLATLDSTLKAAVKELPEEKTRVFAAFVEMLRWFAGHQIRNVAAIGGNIMTASPISDLNPLLLACGAVLDLVSTDGSRRSLKMDSTFFKGYRKTAVLPSEILVSILIPFSKKGEFFYGYKQANRKEDDISIVNAGMRVVLDEKAAITDLSLAFGGMAPITVMATNTMIQLIGRSWNEEMLDKACQLLTSDLPLAPGSPGGTVEYRRTLTVSFFFKFYLTGISQDARLKPSDSIAAQPFEREPVEGMQWFEVTPELQSPESALRRPLVHESAYKQASGEAMYTNDTAPRQGELYLALVLSTKARARLVKVDPSAALAMPGVVDFVTHTDIPGSNSWGLHVKDDVVFAVDERAAQAVVVEYDVTEPVITIADAIKKGSLYDYNPTIVCGDVDKAMAEADHVLEGEVHIEAQEHFYLEPHVAIAYPGEEDQIEVRCIAGVLGVQCNKVKTTVKRLGGGFGGKESRSAVVALPVAVAAVKHKSPVRCALERDEDMMMSGTRHPFLGKYKIGFSSDGKILAYDVTYYSNAGCSVDLSFAVLENVVIDSDNAYFIPNRRMSARACKTNLPSSTAFRGFGRPQGAVVTETAFTRVREINLYKKGDATHYRQVLDECNLQRCWADVKTQSQFDTRRKQADDFNSKNRWRKRGLAITPNKFGFNYYDGFMNQGAALVNIYTDGTVLVSHGGVEMGQGLHTKILQITVNGASIDVVPNTSPSAASVSSDMFGGAVVDACEKLLRRLKPIKTANPKFTWEQLVHAAYMERISLSATGFYKTPGAGYNFTTGKGERPHGYFSFSAAVTEVEIDCLTGDHQILRTDIVFDVGKSINPAIDIGQIEGGFIQGYGLMVLEQYKVQPDGTLLTRGPGTYKIPSVGNIPQKFNVTLLRESGNPRAVYSSKGIGEPPLLLATSVLSAIHDAIRAARKDEGLDLDFRLDTPATPARIRMACSDRFTKMFETEEENKAKPWFVDL
ncbi:hypothetical protein BaRGS_00003237 [Batillaria attramentaria]|uniref:FAD-binding PCMH-type domain-containing protein n=1 Tax=Batillaria attramentaria TaxID=370345 RepID=A0ABD0M1K0_9CAEN